MAPQERSCILQSAYPSQNGPADGKTPKKHHKPSRGEYLPRPPGALLLYWLSRIYPPLGKPPKSTLEWTANLPYKTRCKRRNT